MANPSEIARSLEEGVADSRLAIQRNQDRAWAEPSFSDWDDIEPYFLTAQFRCRRCGEVLAATSKAPDVACECGYEYTLSLVNDTRGPQMEVTRVP